AAAEDGAERGVQPRHPRRDLEAALGHQRLGLGAAAMFDERQLRLGVNRMGQLDEVATPLLHDVLDDRRRCGGWHRRSISPSVLVHSDGADGDRYSHFVALVAVSTSQPAPPY